MSLFASLGDDQEKRFANPSPVANKTSKQNLLLKEKELLGFFLTGHPMDAYRDISRRLSCVPLSKVEEMDHDAVFRAAFYVESLNIKISKSQKKFAILAISDGFERYELPIWPEMYEQKSHLMRENQLLYAVVQVDKKEEGVRLSCKWVEDLTQANEAMMEECDKVFDKAKHFVNRNQMAKGQGQEKKDSKRKEKSEPSNKGEPTMNKKGPLHIKLDVNRTRLSHILKIKELFAQNRGEIPVQIVFFSQDREVGTLSIDPRWGVDQIDILSEQLRTLPSLIEILA